jgi:glycerophosphoryl diester phosphodiesterase
VREPDSTYYTMLHDRKIMCILGTMGNLDRQAEGKGDKVYYDLISRGKQDIDEPHIHTPFLNAK